MEGDPSGLVEAYKKIFDLQEEYNRRERERDEQGEQDSENESKRGQWLLKIKKGVTSAASKGVGVMKQGVSIARGWAVALLAVDGAAMAVVGRLSQMAVEYDNTAGSINMAASEMKAWEDTLKAAGADSGEIQSSFQAVYENSVKMARGEGDSGFMSAMARLGVRATTETGEARNPGEVFGDIIKGLREAVESGRMRQMDALSTLGQTGVSTKLYESLMAKQPGGEYRVNEDEYQKFLKRAEGLDQLADSSREVSESMTDLSSVVRSKLTTVLTRMVESGVLTDLLDRITAFIEGIDADKVAEVMDRLITSVEKVIDFIGFLIPKEEERKALEDSNARKEVLLDALKEDLGLIGYGKFQLEARGKYSPGSYAVTEEEALLKAQQIGLNVNQIYGQAGFSVNNNIQVLIDGKNIPSRTQESQAGPGRASSLGGSLEQ